MISRGDFEKIIIKTGTIIDAQLFPEAHKPAYKLYIDFGEEIGIKQSSAQITYHYTTKELVGKQIVAVVNFPPKQIGPRISEVLVLGVTDSTGGVLLLTTDKLTNNGVSVH